MKRNLFFLFSILMVLVACSSAKKASRNTIKQGIQGTVTEQTGNQMPMKGAPPSVPTGIKTTVFIYEPTRLTDVQQVGGSPVYTSIRTKRVASVETDSTGAFQVALPVGSYSLFVKQGNQFYANLFDSQNNIALFEVEEGKLTNARLTVSSRANF
jgi:hypothetical protein